MKKISTILKNLKNLGVSGVKQSTEDEGSSFDDISLMRKITKKIGLNLNVKIGGCEAKNDIFFCKRVNVDGIVAPMVESKYALKKFGYKPKVNPENGIKKFINWYRDYYKI